MARKGQVIDQELYPLCEEADHPLYSDGMCLCGAARLEWGVIELRDRHGKLLVLIPSLTLKFPTSRLPIAIRRA